MEFFHFFQTLHFHDSVPLSSFDLVDIVGACCVLKSGSARLGEFYEKETRRKISHNTSTGSNGEEHLPTFLIPLKMARIGGHLSPRSVWSPRVGYLPAIIIIIIVDPTAIKMHKITAASARYTTR